MDPREAAHDWNETVAAHHGGAAFAPAPSGEYVRTWPDEVLHGISKETCEVGHMTGPLRTIEPTNAAQLAKWLLACEAALAATRQDALAQFRMHAAAAAERDALKAENVQLRAVLERNDPVMFKAFQEDDEARHRAIAERDSARAALRDLNLCVEHRCYPDGTRPIFATFSGLVRKMLITPATAAELAKAKEAGRG